MGSTGQTLAANTYSVFESFEDNAALE